jgi:hypothetical protein
MLYTEARPKIYKYSYIHGKKYNRTKYSYFAAGIAAVQPQDAVPDEARFFGEVSTILHISAHVSTSVINIRLLKSI